MKLTPSFYASTIAALCVGMAGLPTTSPDDFGRVAATAKKAADLFIKRAELDNTDGLTELDLYTVTNMAAARVAPNASDADIEAAYDFAYKTWFGGNLMTSVAAPDPSDPSKQVRTSKPVHQAGALEVVKAYSASFRAETKPEAESPPTAPSVGG